MVINIAATKAISNKRFLVVQKNETPFKNPINSGGSPRGVNEPPTLATKKIKKTTMCTFLFRHSLALKSGLINSMAAPVVPIQLASRVPSTKNPVFTIGEPIIVPFTLTPPEIVNNANKRIIKGKYSNKYTCITSYSVISNPLKIISGTTNDIAQKNETFPKCLCQKCSATKGKMAILNSIPTNGIIHNRLKPAPSNP